MSSSRQDFELHEIAELKGGFAFKSEDYSEEGVFILRTLNITQSGRISRAGATFIPAEKAVQFEKFSLKHHDTLFVMVGATLGKVGLVKDSDLPALLNQNMWVVRGDNSKVNLLYLHYCFAEESKKLLGWASGAARDFARRDDYRNLKISLPSRYEQDTIANFIGAIDDKINLNNQINQTLEAMAQAIFKSWFVDFEPVKAKMAVLQAGGSQAEAELAAMMAISGKTAEHLSTMRTTQADSYQQLTQTAALFPAALQDSELGEIPEGWESARLDSYIDVLNGFAFKSEDYVPEGIFVLRTKNFNNGVANILSDDVYLPLNFEQTYQKYLCEAFDYHLVMVGASVGSRGIVFPDILPALRNQNMWCFRPKENSRTSKSFVKYLLDNLIKSLQGLASGSAREFYRKGDFESKLVCFGDELIQKQFSELVMPLLSQQATNFAINNKLENIRDSLLPKLLSGEIDLTTLQEVAND